LQLIYQESLQPVYSKLSPSRDDAAAHRNIHSSEARRLDNNDRRRQEHGKFANASLRDFTQPVTRGNATPHRSSASLLRPSSSCFAPLVILPPQPRARLPDPRVYPGAFPLAIQPRRRYIRRMCIILNNPCMPLRCIMTDVDSKRGERKERAATIDRLLRFR